MGASPLVWLTHHYLGGGISVAVGEARLIIGDGIMMPGLVGVMILRSGSPQDERAMSL
jgi:hypothetical protein